MEEAELIPHKFCKAFGKSGIPVYNDLRGVLGDRDKNCIPFMNMCLRTWLERLIIDPDIWADHYLFDFDKWVEEKMAEPMSKHHDKKSSYELMMAVFAKK